MTFEKDIFISYAHLDNQPLTPDQQGWITRFHSSLEAMLSMRMGSRAKIWRDDKLQGMDVFSDEILDQFQHTALLLSVLTPRYLNSEWCTREVREFCKSAEDSGGVVVENKARVIKVIKTPVDAVESLPSVMKDVLGYEFFTVEDDAPLELDPAFGEKYAQDYNRKVGKLAWDVAQLLKALTSDNGDITKADDQPSEEEDQSSKPKKLEEKPVVAKPSIYLAECSYDHREAREVLEGELKRHGYLVLPNTPLPREEDEYVSAVESLLASCTLSIHLVGKSYGAVPDGPSQKSVVILQNEASIQRSKSGALQRVIWLPDGSCSEQPEQQKFIEALHKDADAQYGADLITGDLEELKTSIHATLKQLEKPGPDKFSEQPGSEEDSKLIYLICDQKDRKATIPVRKYCREQGLDVAIPAFEGDATELREANQQLLTTCDAVLLFYGVGDEAWKRTVDNELKKMKGYRSGKNLQASYTYLADPKTSDKEELIDLEEPNLINGLGGFSEDVMATFFQDLN